MSDTTYWRCHDEVQREMEAERVAQQERAIESIRRAILCIDWADIDGPPLNNAWAALNTALEALGGEPIWTREDASASRWGEEFRHGSAALPTDYSSAVGDAFESLRAVVLNREAQALMISGEYIKDKDNVGFQVAMSAVASYRAVLDDIALAIAKEQGR